MGVCSKTTALIVYTLMYIYFLYCREASRSGQRERGGTETVPAEALGEGMDGNVKTVHIVLMKLIKYY